MPAPDQDPADNLQTNYFPLSLSLDRMPTEHALWPDFFPAFWSAHAPVRLHITIPDCMN